MQRLTNTRWKQLGLGLFGFVVFCCVAIVMVGLLNPQPKTTASAPTNGAQMVVAESPVPAKEPEPTAVPEPTSVREDPAVAAYAQQVATYTAQIGQGLTKIAALSQDPQFGSNNWKIQMATAIFFVQDGHKQLQGIQPPASMQAVHTALLAATSDCNVAMTHLTKGIDMVSAAELQTASTLMQSCGNKTGAVTQQLSATIQAP